MAPQRLRLEIDASPAYEFVLSLAAAAGSGRRSGVEAGAAAFSGGCDMIWVHLLTVAYSLPPPRDPDALIGAVAALHPRELRLRLLGYYVRWFRRATPPAVMAAAVDGDPAAMATFRETSYPDDAPWQAALAALLPLGAEETRRRLVALLRGWREPFAALHQPASLQAEVAARRAQARGVRAERMVAAVMDGWEYVPEPGIGSLLLVPSIAIWPWSHVFDHEGTKIVCYPLRVPEAEPSEPISRLSALGAALGDERRLRILRQLAAGDLTAGQLSARLAISLTTLLHHLGRLRDAGLVSDGSRGRPYRLRRDAIAGLGSELDRYLG